MAMKRITWRGVTLSQRTADMVAAAEKLCGFTLTPTQGSYNRGGVSASAGTHDGGGAVDVRARTLTAAQKKKAVEMLRKVGFAAWLRKPSEGPWVEHIHCEAVGDPELSRGAKNQVTAYLNGRNGLASNGKDNATRAYVGTTWEKYAAAAKAAQAALGYSGPVNGVPIHSWSVNYATKAKPINGVTAKDATQFVAFARSQGLVSLANEDLYHDHLHKGEWAKASEMMKTIIKSVQRKAKVSVDGVFGRQTGGYMDNFGYRVYYNG